MVLRIGFSSLCGCNLKYLGTEAKRKPFAGTTSLFVIRAKKGTAAQVEPWLLTSSELFDSLGSFDLNLLARDIVVEFTELTNSTNNYSSL